MLFLKGFRSLKLLVPPAWLEHATPALRMRCSTNWAKAALCNPLTGEVLASYGISCNHSMGVCELSNIQNFIRTNISPLNYDRLSLKPPKLNFNNKFCSEFECILEPAFWLIESEQILSPLLCLPWTTSIECLQSSIGFPIYNCQMRPHISINPVFRNPFPE